mmetsp:Transcript_7827/g.19522  ORF Transcript_7827/g.19522 Transcript_7827/m.19522 type:complete len:81 (-) Transcript_7827:861-1103(-)
MIYTTCISISQQDFEMSLLLIPPSLYTDDDDEDPCVCFCICVCSERSLFKSSHLPVLNKKRPIAIQSTQETTKQKYNISS